MHHKVILEIKKECAGGGSDKPAPEMLQLLSVTMEAIIPEINTPRLTETKNTVEIKVLYSKSCLVHRNLANSSKYRQKGLAKRLSLKKQAQTRITT